MRLVLIPVPSKGSFVLPDEEVVANAGFAEFVERLESEGVPVFDATDYLREYKAFGNRVFLASDSHWTPGAMRICALFLARFLEERNLRPESVRELFTGGRQEHEGVGDLAQLLEHGQGDHWRESVTLHPIHRPGGGPLHPVEGSPVLLMGDSFTNVFSLPEMGWGSEAGFAEALSHALGFTVDRLARNADGALASRIALREEPGRLTGKKLVIWQFAARELSFGDWRVLELPGDDPGRKIPELPDTIELEGTIVAAAPVPALTRTPYRQAVMEFRVADLRGESADSLPSELVLLGMGIEDHKPTELAGWKAGRRISVRVVPWQAVAERYGRLRRLALDDPDLELIDALRVWLVE